METRDFIYWLQGFFELTNPKTINEEQTDLIKRHLALVFIHEIDPAMGDQAHQDKLNAVHAGTTVTVQGNKKISVTETMVDDGSDEFLNSDHLLNIPIHKGEILGVKKNEPDYTVYRC